MYCENPCGSIFESDCGKLMNQLAGGLTGKTENWGNGSMPVKQSLVLNAEKGELVKELGRVGKTFGASEAKTMAALKSHSEAERRRRDRINGHFSTLRDLMPGNEKMDKASLLAEVISQVKQLRETAAQACEGLHIPADTDELEIEMLEKNGPFLLRASLCCDYRPDLLSDVRQAISGLPVKVLKCEISTLGGRVKSVFLITANEAKNGDSAESRENLVRSVRLALSDILDKVSASAEYEKLLFPQKRRRVMNLESSA